MIDIKYKLKSCLIYGAIGDAIGGQFEGRYINENINYDFDWKISDDTQLTVATCEAIYDTKNISAEKIANIFLKWFNERKLTGLGASTLKAMRELQVGGHWALVGRSGEYAAGNGAAMRIAPLAFKSIVSRQIIHDTCSITHKNDEAYVGALAIYYSIKKSLNNDWIGNNNLIELILDDLPDTQIKDRLIEMDNLKHLSINEVGNKYKSTGYVVDSVPLAIFSAQKINQLSFEEIIHELLIVGGDTDTICSMAGQIIGTCLGIDTLSESLLENYNKLSIKQNINKVVENWEM